MLSAYDDDAYIERAIALGTVGFLTKQTAAAQLADAICAVSKGKTFFSPAIMKRMAATCETRRLAAIAASPRRVGSL